MLDILGGALSAVAMDVGDDLAHVLQVIIVILILILLQQIDNDAAGLVACGLATVWRPANLQKSLLNFISLKVKPVWADIGCSMHLWLGLAGSFTLMACDFHAIWLLSNRIADFIHEMMVQHSAEYCAW